MMPKSQHKKFDNINFKIKNICTSKDTTKKIIREATHWKKNLRTFLIKDYPEYIKNI